MEKETYFVDLQNQEISNRQTVSDHGLRIQATPGEVASLRKHFDQLRTADFSSFFRAHIPIKPYHQDEPNDQYDSAYTDVCHMLYELGDDETKTFIGDMIDVTSLNADHD